VFAFIPVVFFTARGIPGEVEERMDTTEGVLSATARALGIRGEPRPPLLLLLPLPALPLPCRVCTRRDPAPAAAWL
jgi:hypothetical protein